MKKITRQVFFGLFLLGSLVLSLSMIQGIKELLEIEEQVKQAEKVTLELEQKKNILQEELEEVNSPDYKETEIRDNLLMAKPNETVVILPDTNTSLSSSVEASQPKGNERFDELLPIWKRWWRLLL